jgi:hypothetical protein
VFFHYLANFADARYDVMHEPAVGNSRLGWTANWNPRNRLRRPAAELGDELRVLREVARRRPGVVEDEAGSPTALPLVSAAGIVFVVLDLPCSAGTLRPAARAAVARDCLAPSPSHVQI